MSVKGKRKNVSRMYANPTILILKVYSPIFCAKKTVNFEKNGMNKKSNTPKELKSR